MKPMKKTKLLLFAVCVAAPSIIGGTAQAQNYPWCVHWHGTGDAKNCGFISYQQCQATAQGAGADCRPNPAYNPREGLH